MCGRVVQTRLPAELKDLYDLGEVADYPPHWNVAPSQEAAVIRVEGDHRALRLLRWGYPKEGRQASIPINARAETAHLRPSFAESIRQRRCVVPVDGFYEWRQAGQSSEPFYLSRRDGAPLSLAGIWRTAEGRTGPVDCFTILTTEPNDLVRPIHDRMPVILDRAATRRWLDPTLHRPEDLAAVLSSRASTALAARRVSPHVNDPRHDDPSCTEPLADTAPRQLGLFP
jgi:putative SOS response-associated peptidase YedK